MLITVGFVVAALGGFFVGVAAISMLQVMGKEQDPQWDFAPMPPPGTWFPVSDVLRQRCCDCDAVHIWRFRVRDKNLIEVSITREES